MTRRIWQVYDADGKGAGYFLFREEAFAKAYAAEIGGSYELLELSI